jgi:hypothetical protein
MEVTYQGSARQRESGAAHSLFEALVQVFQAIPPLARLGDPNQGAGWWKARQEHIALGESTGL